VNDTNKEEFVVKEGFGIAARQIGAGQFVYPERGRFYPVNKCGGKPMRSLPRGWNKIKTVNRLADRFQNAAICDLCSL